MNPKPTQTWASEKVDRYLINWDWIKIQYNKGDSMMGRCGGGWLYKFGIMGSAYTIVIELTWITIRVTYRKPKQ